MKHKHALMFSLILFCTFAICLSVYAGDSTIYGCYKKTDGQLRVVNQGGKCLPSEVAITWNQAGLPGPAGPTGPAGPAGPQGPPSPLSNNSANITVHQIAPNLCAGMYGWCPDGFKWAFRIMDSEVNGGSVVAINIVNPLLYDYGCEVATKGVGEFLIFCIGQDYVKPGAILQYAVFNP